MTQGYMNSARGTSGGRLARAAWAKSTAEVAFANRGSESELLADRVPKLASAA